MTTFAAVHGSGTTSRTQPVTQRFLRSLTSAGAIMMASIEAARAMESANSAEARDAVLDRFADALALDAPRSAA